MRVPRDLVPFVLAEAADCLDSFESFPASPDSCLEFGDPTTCTSSASPVGSLEPDASPASPDRCFEGETPTTCTSSASLVGSVEPNAPPASVSATKSRVFVTPVSPASLSGLCETTASDLPVSVTESEQPFPADSLYTQAEINAAEALLLSVTGPASNPKSASQQDHELTIFPWGGLTSTGVTLTNTCPLDNWLIIFQALVKSNKVKLEDLPESGHTIGTALKLIDDGQYADAKLLILQSLPQQQQGMYASLFFYKDNLFNNKHGCLFRSLIMLKCL